jgi:hypothetical protein
MAGRFLLRDEEEPEPDRVVTLRKVHGGVSVLVNGNPVIKFRDGCDFIDRHTTNEKTGLRNDEEGFVAFKRKR